MNKNPPCNQQAEPKQLKLRKLRKYVLPKPGKWLPQHLYQKINNIVGSMLERTPNNNF